MTTKWITASLPAGTGTDGEGDTPAALAGVAAPAAIAAADVTTMFTDMDAFGAAVIAITGDTYSNTTHKFTFGGATGLTHAQWATLGADYNTAVTDIVAVSADITASNALVAGVLPSQSVTVGYDSGLSTNQVKAALRKIIASLGN